MFWMWTQYPKYTTFKYWIVSNKIGEWGGGRPSCSSLPRSGYWVPGTGYWVSLALISFRGPDQRAQVLLDNWQPWWTRPRRGGLSSLWPWREWLRVSTRRKGRTAWWTSCFLVLASSRWRCAVSSCSSLLTASPPQRIEREDTSFDIELLSGWCKVFSSSRGSYWPLKSVTSSRFRYSFPSLH